MDQNCNDSSEDDGDEKWKAAIHSAAVVDYIFCASNGTGKEEAANTKPHGLKLNQTRAQKLLNEMLEESLEFVIGSCPTSRSETQISESSIRLFSKAPPGIIFDSQDAYQRPTKRPCIIPKEHISEKSKEFKHRIRSTAVDGSVVIANAQDAVQRCLARYEARIAKSKAAVAREEERITELKKKRGEKWLPSFKSKAR